MATRKKVTNSELDRGALTTMELPGKALKSMAHPGSKPKRSHKKKAAADDRPRLAREEEIALLRQHESDRAEPSARRRRGEEIRERQELAGIPESKRFGGSDEQDEEFDSRPIMNCHVGGVSVRDLPVLAQRMVHYDQTDEGFAEKNSKRKGYGASVSTDAIDKTLRERDHDLKNAIDHRFAANPLKFLDAYKRPGYKQKLLSTKNGNLDPDYEIIRKKNGEPLKYKNMFVGERRIDDIKQRNRYIKQRSDARLKMLTEKHVSEGGVVPKDIDRAG